MPQRSTRLQTVVLFFYCVNFVECSSNCYQYTVKSLCTLPVKYLFTIDTTFYAKYVEIHNVLIMSSDNTPDWSLAEAARVLDIIVMNLRPDLVKAFKMQGWKILFYGPDENLCSIPETSGRSCVPSNATGITVGNLIIVPYVKYMCRSNGFMTYSTLVHELGHALNAAFNQTDPNLQLMIQSMFENAKRQKIWHHSNHYARKDVNEYFASLWEPFWFKNDRTCAIDHSMCSKDALIERDPWFLGIMAKLMLGYRIREITGLSCEYRCHPKTVTRSVYSICALDFGKNVVRLENTVTKRLLTSDLYGLVWAQSPGNNIFQKWKIKHFDGRHTYFEIRNVGSGLVLQSSINGRIYASKAFGQASGPNHLWRLLPDKTIINVGTKVLLASGGHGLVFAYPLLDAMHKQWNIRR